MLELYFDGGTASVPMNAACMCDCLDLQGVHISFVRSAAISDFSMALNPESLKAEERLEF